MLSYMYASQELVIALKAPMGHHIPLRVQMKTGSRCIDEPTSCMLTHTPYNTRMIPENTHKFMGFYMEVLILGILFWYMVSASLGCFL